MAEYNTFEEFYLGEQNNFSEPIFFYLKSLENYVRTNYPNQFYFMYSSSNTIRIVKEKNHQKIMGIPKRIKNHFCSIPSDLQIELFNPIRGGIINGINLTLINNMFPIFNFRSGDANKLFEGNGFNGSIMEYLNYTKAIFDLHVYLHR